MTSSSPGPARRGGSPGAPGCAFAAVGEPSAAHAERAWAPVWSPETSPGMAAVVQDLFIGLHARLALPSMLALVETWRPDVVVRETLEFASALAAERRGVPQVRVGVHLDSDTDADPRLLGVATPALDALRPSLGLAPDPEATAIRESPVLTLAPASTSGAATALRFRDTTRRAGASSCPRWGDPAAPLVYVSFGSEAAASHHFPGVYRRAAEALAALPVRVLLTIGDRRDPAELGTLPPSVRVERWMPQAGVMAHASAMVGHGGSGSTLMALAAGVPLALVPLFVDGPTNARRVAELGAGHRARARPGRARRRRRRAAHGPRPPGRGERRRGRDPRAAARRGRGRGARGGQARAGGVSVRRRATATAAPTTAIAPATSAPAS